MLAVRHRRGAVGNDQRVEFDEAVALLLVVAGDPRPRHQFVIDRDGGSLAVVVNAVLDALSDYGITQLDMPLTSERIWRAIEDGKKAKAA